MKERPYWLNVLISIWPTFKRLVNGVIYFLLKVIKGFIRTALGQI